MERGIESMVECPKVTDADNKPMWVSYVWKCLDCKHNKGRKFDDSGIALAIINCDYGE